MLASFLQRLIGRWRGSNAGAARIHIRIFSRQSCHLCEVARAQLEQARRQYEFSLEEIDVDADAELARLYGNDVPVVTVNGKVRFRGMINPVLLRRLLRAAERGD
jgi:glutaredoxin